MAPTAKRPPSLLEALFCAAKTWGVPQGGEKRRKAIESSFRRARSAEECEVAARSLQGNATRARCPPQCRQPPMPWRSPAQSRGRSDCFALMRVVAYCLAWRSRAWLCCELTCTDYCALRCTQLRYFAPLLHVARICMNLNSVALRCADCFELLGIAWRRLAIAVLRIALRGVAWRGMPWVCIQ